jgi:transcriptional regulator with XRE-family HTH domain
MSGQLELRNVQRSVYATAAERLANGAHESVATSRWESQEIADRLDMDPASVSRILRGKQNPTWELLAFIHLECPEKRLLRAEAETAGYDVRPKPPPSASEELAAERMVLAEMGILDVVKQKAARLARAAEPEDAP